MFLVRLWIKPCYNDYMIKRFVAKYDKNPPHHQVSEEEVNCTPNDMRHLFDVEDDHDMIFVYDIKTQEQIDFFREWGAKIDPEDGFYYIECYEV